ncbi:MAG: DoxX family protein [Ferruginibacter sp.]
MAKFLSTKYSATAFDVAILILRVASGVLMMNHGYGKLIHFSEYKVKFMSFMGLGQTTSLLLVVFAEFFCALFIVLGLFTRFAVIPLIIAMCVALFMAHSGDFFGDGEKATLYIGAFVNLLLVGPGRFSVDRLFGK